MHTSSGSVLSSVRRRSRNSLGTSRTSHVVFEGRCRDVKRHDMSKCLQIRVKIFFSSCTCTHTQTNTRLLFLLRTGRCQSVQLPCQGQREGARGQPPLAVAVFDVPGAAGQPNGRHRCRLCSTFWRRGAALATGVRSCAHPFSRATWLCLGLEMASSWARLSLNAF